MQARPGELSGYMHAIIITAKDGPLAFMKGIVPSSLRLTPGTVLMFICLEQLTKHFGYIEEGQGQKNVTTVNFHRY